jgi:hypothetical protein
MVSTAQPAGAPATGPPPTALAVSSAAMSRLAEPSPVHGVRAIPRAGSPPPAAGFFATGTPVPPFAASSAVMTAPPMVQPAYPAYPRTLPLPVSLANDARYLRPGFELPRGGPAQRRRVASLTATQVLHRRDHRWTVALVTAVAVLVAAAAVIVATRRDPPTLRVHADDRSAPVTAPAAAGSASPAPTSHQN